MYRSKITTPVNFPLHDLPTLDSYRAGEDPDPYKKNRMSSSKERPRVSTKHRLLSTEKSRITDREREEIHDPKKRLEAEFLSTKELNRDPWPQFRKDNEENVSRWRSIDQNGQREYKGSLTELDDLRYEYGMLKERYNVTLNRIDRIENENRDVTIKYEGLKGDYRILEEQYDLCKIELDKTRGHLRKQERSYLQRVASIEGELRALLDEKTHLQEENEHLKERITKSLETQEEKMKIEEEKKDMARKFRESQERQEKLRDEVDELRREKKKYTDKIHELEKHNKEMFKDNKKLAQESENAEMRMRVISEDTKKLRIIVEELRAKNAAYSKEEKKLREERLGLEYELNALTKGHEEVIERYKDFIVKLREFSLRRRFEAAIEDKERDLEITRESYAKIQQKKTMLEEDKLRIERKMDIMAQNFEEKEREYRREAGVLLERVNRLNEVVAQLQEENENVNNGLKTQEEENRKCKEEIKSLDVKNKELIVLLDESQREKERMKNNMRDLLEQNKEIQKKEEEIMKQKIKEQEYLSQIRTLESFVKSYKEEKTNERAQERRSWAASPMRMQGRINDRTSERKTWNERIEGTAERGMYGQRVWDRSGERQKGYRDTSAQKPRESIKRGNDIEDDIIEQPTSFRNQFLEKLERDENRDERLTNGRKSVTNQEEKEATIKGTLMSGNPQVRRLAQKYNQIKNKYQNT